MVVYRLARKKYAQELSGKGAALFGARWNSKGVELIYTSANRSLSMAEVVVHLTLATMPSDYQMISIEIPDYISIKEINESSLPEDWNVFPHQSSTQHIGDDFVAKKEACILKVPSAVTKGDFNILINPNHPDFEKIKIKNVEPFPFDRRLFK